MTSVFSPPPLAKPWYQGLSNTSFKAKDQQDFKATNSEEHNSVYNRKRSTLRVSICNFQRFLEKLVGGFNPSERYPSNWKSFPNRDEHKKYLKSPPSKGCFTLLRCNYQINSTQSDPRRDPRMIVGSVTLSCFHPF